MQQFTNQSCTATKQRKDSPERRMERDAANLDKISSKPVVRSPFWSDYSLGDPMTGVVTGEGVTVQEHESTIFKPMHNII